MNHQYAPEGSLIRLAENREYISSVSGLERAMNEGRILESTALLCDNDMRLHVDLYGIRGIMERDEVLFCRRGEVLKDIAIITRVGKPVCFKVLGFTKINGETVARLSRRAAQLECHRNYLSLLCPGDIIPATVTHMEGFGAFVDVGCGLSSLLSVDTISISRISHPSDRLKIGQTIHTVVKSVDRSRERIFVSMRELLGTWEENAAQFKAGQTVAGIIRSVENYGVFVELAPNLAGLAELREVENERMIPSVGQYAAVYIKSIIPERMKIKLVLIDSYKGEPPRSELRYFIDCNKVTHLDRWQYSPNGTQKTVETVFEDI
ncbi:MAG: 30S ribosomal protein S1 [Clostridia bacterium]|nr:30S ribosomal protein S1 [Clostridia bacterium]